MKRLWLIAITLSACWVRGPERNGLDGELYFSSWFYAPAIGATNHISVQRTDGDRVCIEGKSGESCPSSDAVPIAIDAASCGDGCTATIEVDSRGYPYVDVIATTTDAELAIDVHALDGSGAWHDRYPLRFKRATELRVMTVDDVPMGVTYAAEPDASTVVVACLISTSGDCLEGTFATTVTGDGIVEVAAEPPPEWEPEWPRDYTRVHLAGAGTGTLHIAALGFERTLELRAADPTTWTEIRFAKYHFEIGDVVVDASGFLGADVTSMTVPSFAPTGTPVAATAMLADGSRALISVAHVECTPADRIAMHGWSTNTGAWRGFLEPPDWEHPSRGDATCVVAGHAELGSLAVHVD